MTRYCGFDVETNVTEDLPSRKLYVVAVSFDDWEWVVDWVRCPQWCKNLIKEIAEDDTIVKIGHNILFDIQMMWLQDINTKNVWDTMLAEVILHNGLLKKLPSLAEVVEERLFLFMDKSVRTSYNGEELSEKQIYYAAKDVRYMMPIRRLQYLDLHKERLTFTAALEMEAVVAVARLEFDGVGFSPERWKETLYWAEERFEQARLELQETVENDPLIMDKMIATNKMIVEDKFVINWSSHQQRTLIAQHYFAPMTGLGKPMLKRMAAAAEQAGETRFQLMFLNAAEGDFSEMEAYLIETDKSFLIERGLLHVAGSCLINWNSTVQMKEIGMIIAPNIRSMEAKYLKSRKHPFFKALINYNEWQKKVGTYGDSFLKHIQSDGRIRTRYTQIVDTGRLSSSNPNIQNIPAKGEIGSKYRRAFVPAEGNVLIGADFSGQELVLASYIYKQKEWTEALKAGHDLHSVVAEMVFGDLWKNSAEEDCVYYNNNKKQCSCKKHKELRTKVKSVNFGLIYGISGPGLSEQLTITVDEAFRLIRDYFSKLPALEKMLKAFQSFGIRHGYIMTAHPFYRKRWFPFWEEYKQYTTPFLAGVYNHQQLGEMARQSSNTPIQGSGADMTKTALVLVLHRLMDKGWLGKVKMALTVHDEIVLESPMELQDEVKELLGKSMSDAGMIIVPNGLIKAETNISNEWSK